jgi:hypothetical protein
MKWTPAQLKAYQKGKPLPAKANELTAAIVDYLNLNGFEAWRQNNAAIFDTKTGKHRAFVGKLGLPDIIGYHKKTAVWIAVEVKAGKDKLSDDQRRFLADLKKAGGIAIEARTFDQFLKELQK